MSAGKSDRAVVEMGTEEESGKVGEPHKENRLNYRKADAETLKMCFGDLNWKELTRAGEVQENYDRFMEAYVRLAPKYRPREEGKRIGLIQSVPGQRKRAMEYGKIGRETRVQDIRRTSRKTNMWK